jgi:signal transduction histidine kinase
MSHTTKLAHPEDVEQEVRTRTAELLHSIEALREELKQERLNSAELTRRLQIAQVTGQTDREVRRAALNLLEDAVESRLAEQAENERRRRVEEELREADRRKDEFLATLAHELRNPLAPIRSGIEILHKGKADAEAREAMLAMLKRQTDHLIRLVNDLMDVSRITRGKIELQRELVSVADIVQSAVETSQPLIDAAGHRLIVELSPEPIFVNADAIRLAQVLTNLLDNAAKFAECAGRIRISTARDGPNAVIAVRDTGPGIPAEALSLVFDMFFQLDRSYTRAKGGLGIGLTLARMLVEMHGGRIEVRSEGPGLGSEFAIWLPLPNGAADGKPANERERPMFSLAGRRILVVDDNRDAAEMLGMLLRMVGGEVQTVTSGQAALDVIRTFQPSIVFLDLGMPGMDGIEVARRARKQPEGRDATLIAVTGWGQAEDRRKTKDAGFDHHLVKPVNLESIQALLATPH